MNYEASNEAHVNYEASNVFRITYPRCHARPHTHTPPRCSPTTLRIPTKDNAAVMLSLKRELVRVPLARWECQDLLFSWQPIPRLRYRK